MDPRILVEVAIVAAGAGLWFAAFWVALLATRPRTAAPGPPGQDFGGDEPPAVVSLLAGRWELTEDAAESTLIDLAARRILEFRQPANDPLHTTVHVRERQPAGLNAYERMVFDRVMDLAVGGTVPMTALTFRDRAAAKAWTNRLHAAVVADARLRGLSQRRFSAGVVSALTVFAAVPAVAFVLAAGLDMARRGEESGSWGGLIVPGVIVWTAFGVFAGRSRGERDTPDGRIAAARWLGLQRWLRAHESFAALPPAAVAVWDRYLSYGDALGTTRVCAAVIDLGMGNRRNVWSSFGGTWHRVRVRYPRFLRRYGQKALPLFVKAAAALAVAFLVVRFDALLYEHTPAGLLDWVVRIVRVVFLATFLYGAYTLTATIAHVLLPVTVTGEVLWVQEWRSTPGGEDSPPIAWLHHLAVDDGRSDRTVAWGCPSAAAERLKPGDVVTLTARHWTRRVVRLRVDRSSRVPVPPAETAHMDQLIERAMSGTSHPAAPEARIIIVKAADRLVTAGEAGQLLRRAATLRGGAPSAAVATFEPRDDSITDRALVVTVSGGDRSGAAIRAHRGGTPLPQVGADEAYTSGGWAVARRGHVVVALEQRGTARVDQQRLAWLLEIAVSRLT